MWVWVWVCMRVFEKKVSGWCSIPYLRACDEAGGIASVIVFGWLRTGGLDGSGGVEDWWSIGRCTGVDGMDWSMDWSRW